MPAPPCPFKVAEYRLVLDVDFAKLRWKGSVEFDVEGSAPEIDLDGLRLEVEGARVDRASVPVEVDEAHERIRLKAPVRGQARVAIDFAGAVAEHSLMGLYRSRYGSSYILTSQAEPDAAHSIFPCFDRPDIKAVVKLTVTAPAELEVVSNSPTISVAEEHGRKRWTFAPTPPMATYLFYLGVGVFDHLNGAAGRIALSVLTPPGRTAEGRRALEVTTTALEELERYYRVPYPLPKLDLIAVPEFPAGAMENWGAITFRDMQLLIGEKTPAFEMRYTVATIIHELAHQWFGNLVTPYWWTDIWLNESFATFVEHKVVERRYPELKSTWDFLSIWTQWGFLLDSVPTNHPIVVEVNSASDVSQAIDRLTYGKGASVLRMVEGYLGSEKFENGVAQYIEEHAWKNAASQDLWRALDHASGEPITRILRPWIERPSHPLVTAHLTPEGLELSQRPFGYLPRPTHETWPIPMVVEIEGKVQRILFETPTLTVPIPAGATVHLNSGALGFYRSRYDAPLTERLLATFAKRSPSDRWIVLEDLWAFLLSGDVDLDTYAKFVRTLDGATDYLTVGATAAHLANLRTWAFDRPKVVQLVRDFLATHWARVGLDPRPGEDSLDASLRESIVRARVPADPAFAKELAGLFPQREKLDANVRGAVAVAYASTGGRAAFEAIRAALSSAASETETLQLEVALVSSSEPELVEAALELGRTGAINKGHYPRVLVAAANNAAGRVVTWRYLEQHFPEIQERYRGTTLLTDFLDLALPSLGLGSPEAVPRYFREHEYPADSKAIARGLSMFEVAEKLLRRLGAE